MFIVTLYVSQTEFIPRSFDLVPGDITLIQRLSLSVFCKVEDFLVQVVSSIYSIDLFGQIVQESTL